MPIQFNYLVDISKNDSLNHLNIDNIVCSIHNSSSFAQINFIENWTPAFSFKRKPNGIQCAKRMLAGKFCIRIWNPYHYFSSSFCRIINRRVLMPKGFVFATYGRGIFLFTRALSLKHVGAQTHAHPSLWFAYLAMLLMNNFFFS